jgi:hypothetical protein
VGGHCITARQTVLRDHILHVQRQLCDGGSERHWHNPVSTRFDKLRRSVLKNDGSTLEASPACVRRLRSRGLRPSASWRKVRSCPLRQSGQLGGEHCSLALIQIPTEEMIFGYPCQRLLQRLEWDFAGGKGQTMALANLKTPMTVEQDQLICLIPIHGQGIAAAVTRHAGLEASRLIGMRRGAQLADRRIDDDWS